MKKVEEVIPVVEYEIVEELPDNSFPVPIVDKDDLPETAVIAPDPSALRYGYFEKGGRGGPGRKRFYQNPAQMEQVCMEYFRKLQVAVLDGKTGQMEYMWKHAPTIPGLSRALGFSSEALRQYGMRDEFSDVVEWAKDVIREYYESSLNEDCGNPVGKIFMMKNLGYSDNVTYQFAPPSRLEAAQSPEEIAKLVEDDIV